jgi:hypothetical protein
LACARGLTRLELDMTSTDFVAVCALLANAQRRRVHVQLSWPTTTR